MGDQPLPADASPIALSPGYELEAPTEDQPLPTDALPTALLPGYIDNSNPEEDDEDPEEDHVDYPANEGHNDDNESSDDDDNDDDVEKDGEVDEEEEHLAPVDPSVVPIVDHEMMTTVNQGMSIEEIERVVPGTTPVARAPYRLVPSEMKDLSEQVKELSDKGVIRPSSSPWRAPVQFVKRRMDRLGYA
nr:putative reverse transcriptase domain-containing protein [Tanacetum cinerariifolium]